MTTPAAPPSDPFAEIALIRAESLLHGWRRRPVAERRHLLDGAGRALHALWMRGANLGHLNPHIWPVPFADAPADCILSVERRDRVATPSTGCDLEGLLAERLAAVRHDVPVADLRLFLGAFMAEEPAGPEAVAHLAARIRRRALRDTARRWARHYYRELDRALSGDTAGRTFCWLNDPGLSAEELHHLLQATAARPTVVLKESARIRVLRAPLLGEDCAIKIYKPGNAAERLRYRFRVSRARRAWAAGRAMQAADLPVPESLGFLESHRGPRPGCSWYIARFLPDAPDLRTWAERHYGGLPPAGRRALRDRVARLLRNLEDRGVYHADTKAANLLIRGEPNCPEAWQLWWIDLESVRFGLRPTLARRLRNLVQLNGALAHVVPRDDRCRFLRAVAARDSRLRGPAAVRRIEEWTERRLDRERRGECGP